MRLPIRTATLVAGLLLSACATTGGDEPGSTAELVGKEWVVEDIAGRGVIDYSHATLLFGSDGRLSGNATCNRLLATYSVDGNKLRIGHAGLTMMACPPALMDQERRLVDVLDAVESYRIDGTGALMLSTPAGATVTARTAMAAPRKTTYTCADGSTVEAWYPTTDTARILYKGRPIDMTVAISASGARYVGGGWEWWTKGMTEGTLSPLAPGEDIASTPGISCTAQ